MSKKANLEKRVRALQARNAAKRAELAKVKDTRAARASVANGAAALAPGSVAVGRCHRCGGVLVAPTVNGREVGAPFCRACEAPL